MIDSADNHRLDAYFRSIYEHSRQRMPRNLKTPEAAAILEEFEEGISFLVDRLALRLLSLTGPDPATLEHRTQQGNKMTRRASDTPPR
jgi:hypothetical protein